MATAEEVGADGAERRAKKFKVFPVGKDVFALLSPRDWLVECSLG